MRHFYSPLPTCIFNLTNPKWCLRVSTGGMTPPRSRLHRCEDHLVHAGVSSTPGGTRSHCIPFPGLALTLLASARNYSGVPCGRFLIVQLTGISTMARGKAAEKAAILQRQALALELRKQGFSYRKIGERLKVDFTTAYKDVQHALAQLTALNQEQAEDLRQLQIERLDMAIEGVMPFVMSGSAPHASAFANVVEKQSKIAGILKTEINITINLEIVQRFEQVTRELGIDPAQALEEYIQALHEQSQHSGD